MRWLCACLASNVGRFRNTMSPLDTLNADDVARFHGALLQALKNGAEPPVAASTTLWQAIEDNHRCNIALWDAEDQARRRDVSDSHIANSKRQIDAHNQRRNDAVERIDELILAVLPKAQSAPHLHSETVGALIDRMSILSLKIFHMDWQIQRVDVDAAHRALCRERLVRLSEQYADLVGCLRELLLGCRAGTLYFKVYRQFKMYNDPKFNPWLAGADS